MVIIRSQNFKQHQVIGNVINQCARYNSWNIDELIYIDISYNKIMIHLETIIGLNHLKI